MAGYFAFEVLIVARAEVDPAVDLKAIARKRAVAFRQMLGSQELHRLNKLNVPV
jgi:hypothetical protein